MKLPENQDKNQNDAVEPQISQLLESLLQSITLTQCLKSKWSLIQTKLSDLKSHLSDLTDFPPTTISGDLLRSLSVTLSTALSLSITCHTSTLPHKLKTQNDVDSIISLLDNHINYLHILIKSGVLQDVTTKSSVSSKRESVRIEARSLVTRLQIGSVESRVFALNSLQKLLQEDDKNVVIAVAQGVVPVLVQLLDSGYSFELIENTVNAIAKVSSVESTKHALNAEGLKLLHVLIRVLELGTGLAKEKACVTLQALTLSKENARAIGSRGGIPCLLEICESGTPAAQACAASVLRNLTCFSDVRDNFIEENTVSVLLVLASSGTALAQEHSIACLSNLVRDDDDDMKLLVVRKGGIGSLKNFWDSAPVLRSLEVAVEFLCNLASDQRLIEFIISNGFLNRLISVLNCGMLGVRVYAAEAIYKIGYNAKTRRELGELGFISLLIGMLDGKASEEIEGAAKALSTILMYTDNRKIYKKDQRGIMSVVRLLDPLITNVEKKYPVSILISLTHSKKCRKQMVKCGALLHLQKLVATEVDGAKKLQETIGGGKLWGVFKRPGK